MIKPMPLAWGAVATEYAKLIMPGFQSAALELCRFAGVGPGDSVLDIACGPGTAALAARALGAGAVTGVDYATGMIAVARERTAGLADFTFLEGDAMALPVPDGAFDVAVSSFGLIFAPEPVRAIAEMSRALKPGGHGALLAWLESDVTREYYELVYRHVPRHIASHDPYDWGRPERAASWLATGFTSIESRTIAVPFDAGSPAEAWEILSRATGRVAAAYVELDTESRRAFDGAMVSYFDRFMGADGSVHWPREALMLRGRRPTPRASGPGEVFI